MYVANSNQYYIMRTVYPLPSDLQPSGSAVIMFVYVFVPVIDYKDLCRLGEWSCEPSPQAL
ncbi:hypothetical protein J6590_078168 [Homalodisca vitripennis]|nr:hypothetical protein J6590_078168 [Homalodisca vitripennis]